MGVGGLNIKRRDYKTTDTTPGRLQGITSTTHVGGGSKNWGCLLGVPI